MLNVLINAYAVSPTWGSEPGVGWNWITNIARYCHVDVITEGEWSNEIEEALASLTYRENLTFHYLPVSDKIRCMCWNQGDWRFYWYYRKWQKRALERAREICNNKHIHVIHQLNMIGFREPGYLWKIKNIPFVWGPVGGMELVPMSYLKGASLKQRLFNQLKNFINKHQYRHSLRVKSAIERSSVMISAVKGVQDVLKQHCHKDSILINETGVGLNPDIVKRKSEQNQPLKIIWVGKFDFRKQLPLALRSISAMNKKDIEFHICGSGSATEVKRMQLIAQKKGIQDLCRWHGNINHDKIMGLMATCDLMLFTSIMEATSTVVLEAISVGLPILSFNTCGFGPIVKSFAGITIELSNPDQSVIEFSQKLLEIYNNRNLLNDISNKIIENRESLTWNAKAIQTIELYQGCQVADY